MEPTAAETRASHVPEIARDEILRRLGDPTLKVVNALPREAYEAARIPGSLSLPVAEVRQRAAEVLPDRDQDIALYCGGFT